jgi:DNA-binding beta-propeller fold protein YncE
MNRQANIQPAASGMSLSSALEREGGLRAPWMLLVIALTLVALLALNADGARAETPRLVPDGNFGSAQFHVENTETHQSESTGPIGVAIDQGSGDVFVSSFLNQHLFEFDANGKPIAPPSPFGEGGGHEAGVAVNPVNGDVYVLDGVNQVIDTYDPASGALLSSFAVPGCANAFFGNFTTVQLASDAAGNVYVPCAPENAVRVYSPSGGAPSGVMATIAGSGASALREPTGVAVDSTGHVWVADAGNNRVEEFSPGGVLIRELESEGVQTIALDNAGYVFALVQNRADFCGSIKPPCYHLLQYSSAGVQLADVGAGTIRGPALGLGSDGVIDMVAVNASTGRVYVTDGENGVVWVYVPPAAPTVGRELASEVGVGEAKLGALVAPGGLETTYRFQYGTSTAYGQTAPIPDGDVGQGFNPRTVWAAALGLAPAATYHYRVIATNALGSIAGPDQTFTTQASQQASCPNEQLRTGFSANLPDCRAYELVTPANPGSEEPEVSETSQTGAARFVLAGTQASRDGRRLSFFSLSSFAGSQSDGEQYLATRGATGWVSENEIPPQAGYGNLGCPKFGAAIEAYSSELSAGILSDGKDQRPAEAENDRGGCGADSPELAPGEPHGVANLFVRDNVSAGYQLVDVTPPGVAPAPARFDGGSADLSRVVFDEHARLAPDAPPSVDDLYEWSAGVVRLVTILPGGAPVVGSFATEPGGSVHAYAVSADGSRVLFTAGGDLYVRENAEKAPVEECADASKACTVQVDASQAAGAGGGGQFMGASADGSRVFFLDGSSAGLTSDTRAGSGANLYEYDLSSGRLTDVTPGGEADVEGVSGISEDGSSVYFVAGGALAAGAAAGQPNLYLYHGGALTLIATLSNGDGCVAGGECARVSPSGRFLGFASFQMLTGYDNTDAVTGRRDGEVFLYDAGSGGLACGSCDPSGEAPGGDAKLKHEATRESVPHVVTDSGRLFFESPDALVPSDTNHQTDVYEYEEGQPHLISSGTAGTESVLLDVGESGNDVFVLTRQPLVAQAPPGEAFAIYDARVDGGFPANLSPSDCSTADSCRSAAMPQPPVFGAPASATFSGAGNLAPQPPAPAVKPAVKAKKCKKGFAEKKGRCVRIKPQKKTKKAKRSRARKAGSERRPRS